MYIICIILCANYDWWLVSVVAWMMGQEAPVERPMTDREKMGRCAVRMQRMRRDCTWHSAFILKDICELIDLMIDRRSSTLVNWDRCNWWNALAIAECLANRVVISPRIMILFCYCVLTAAVDWEWCARTDKRSCRVYHIFRLQLSILLFLCGWNKHDACTMAPHVWMENIVATPQCCHAYCIIITYLINNGPAYNRLHHLVNCAKCKYISLQYSPPPLSFSLSTPCCKCTHHSFRTHIMCGISFWLTSQSTIMHTLHFLCDKWISNKKLFQPKKVRCKNINKKKNYTNKFSSRFTIVHMHIQILKICSH